MTCSTLVNMLAKICLNACNNDQNNLPTTIDTVGLEMLENSIKLLTIMSGDFDRSIYVPGQTRESDKNREVFILTGGLLILLCLNCFCVNEQTKDIPINSCFPHLDLNDWQLQSTQLNIMINKAKNNNVDASDDEKDINRMEKDLIESNFFLFNVRI